MIAAHGRHLHDRAGAESLVPDMIACLKGRRRFRSALARSGTEGIGILLRSGTARRLKAELLASIVIVKSLGDVLVVDQLGRDLVDEAGDPVRFCLPKEHA